MYRVKSFGYSVCMWMCDHNLKQSNLKRLCSNRYSTNTNYMVPRSSKHCRVLDIPDKLQHARAGFLESTKPSHIIVCKDMCNTPFTHYHMQDMCNMTRSGDTLYNGCWPQYCATKIWLGLATDMFKDILNIFIDVGVVQVH